jgi:hypothetical protein
MIEPERRIRARKGDGPLMKAVLVALALLAVTGAPALAFQCPILIKQLTDEVTRRGPDDPKVKQARPLIDEARRLHGEGSHARSVATAEEAAKALGIQLKKN